MKAYISAPFGTPGSTKRKNVEKLYKILLKLFSPNDIYCPWRYHVPHAWDYPNTEWGLMVFTNNLYALDNSDFVFVLSYGRKDTTAGTAWEAGYAFAKDTTIVVVEMNDEPQSLMVANGRIATVKGLEGLEKYIENILTCSNINILKTRTNTEQK